MLSLLKKEYILEEAIELQKHGLSVIPLVPNDKKAAVDWKPYQTSRPSEEQISTWFANDLRNVGVITGNVSKIVVLDVDQMDGMKRYADLPETPTVETFKGRHYYFRHPGGELSNFEIKGLGDFRAEGGYVVAPPSFHPKGKQYKWLVDLDTPLADMPPWLLKLAQKKSNRDGPTTGTALTTPYGWAWFKDCEELSVAVEPGRNNLLNKVACKAGSLIAARQLNPVEASTAMVDACRRNGLTKDPGGEGAVLRTIRSGISEGERNPRYPSDPLTTVAEFNPKSGRLKIRSFAEIEIEKVDWLWPGVLAKGALSILAGNPGLGKSQVSLSIAACVSSGSTWPVSNLKAPLGNVIILSMEDRAEDTIKPRLVACGAQLDRVHVITDVVGEDGFDRPFTLQSDMALLEEAIESIGSVSLIVIDPISAYLGKADTNNSGDVRGITTRLSALAQKYGTSILAVSHLNKSEGKQASHRVQGSISWVGAARTGFMVDKDGDDPERRSMTPIKNNLANDRTGYAFTVQSKTLPGDIETSYVVWEDASILKTADQSLTETSEGRGAASEARDFLREMLKDGRKPQSTLLKMAKENDISQPTLYRVKKSLGIESEHIDEVYYWKLAA